MSQHAQDQPARQRTTRAEFGAARAARRQTMPSSSMSSPVSSGVSSAVVQLGPRGLTSVVGPRDVQALQRSIGNQALQRLLNAQGRPRPTVGGAAHRSGVPVIQRNGYEPQDEDGVTVGKTYQMMANWYGAAREVLRQHMQVRATGVLAQQRFKWGEIQAQLKNKFDDPTPIIASADLQAIFPRELPAALYREIAAITGGNEDSAREDLRNAYIRVLNAKDWKPIRRQMDFGTQANPDLVTSTITPVNQYFHETYGPAGKNYGKTGLNSMSSAGRLTKNRNQDLEDKRTTNLAHTELRRGGLAGPHGEVLFAAFRSGALSGKDLPGNANDQATHDNTMELLQAMTIEHLKRLAPGELHNAFKGTTQRISVTSVSLQSGGLGNERGQIDQQLKTLGTFNTGKRHIDVWWTLPGQPPTKHTVAVRFTVIGLNLGVNAQGFTSLNTTIEPALGQLDEAVQAYLDMSAQVVKGKHNAKAVVQAGPSNNLAQAAALAAALQGVNTEIDTIEAKNAQIEALWAAIRDMKGTTGTYKMAGRIANLCFLIGHMVHFNCKSGKDRTGLMDGESKHLALRMDQTSRAGGRVTREGIRHTLTDEEDQDSYQKMLFESGNLQMQDYNTGGQGYKIAPAVGIFPADTELMRRVGGDRVLTQLQGLKRYTDIDQI